MELRKLEDVLSAAMNAVRDGGNDDILRRLANYLVGELRMRQRWWRRRRQQRRQLQQRRHRQRQRRRLWCRSRSGGITGGGAGGQQRSGDGLWCRHDECSPRRQAAEKVAKAEPLELLKKDDEMWREHDGTAFESACKSTRSTA